MHCGSRQISSYRDHQCFLFCVTAVCVWWLRRVRLISLLTLFIFNLQVDEYNRVADAITSAWSWMFKPVRNCVTVRVVSDVRDTHRGSEKWWSETSRKSFDLLCDRHFYKSNQKSLVRSSVCVCGGRFCTLSKAAVSVTALRRSDFSFETSCQMSYSICDVNAQALFFVR